MSTSNTIQVISKDPQALLAFTTVTANTLLNVVDSTNKYNNRRMSLPPLDEFIKEFYSWKYRLPCAVKLFTLIYLLRLKSKLPDNACGGFDTPYRLFLAAVLTSSKYLSEPGTELTNQKVSALTHYVYTPKDMNRIERSFLGLIRYDLWVSTDDIQLFLGLYGDLIQIDLKQTVMPITQAGRCQLLDKEKKNLIGSSSSAVPNNI